MPIDVPGIGARSAVWMASQLHLYFAAFPMDAMGVRLVDGAGGTEQHPLHEDAGGLIGGVPGSALI